MDGKDGRAKRRIGAAPKAAGKVFVFCVGLAVIMTTVIGAASMALAANGKPFILGRNNAASALTTLVKQGPGPALRLLVRPGQPPMSVNSSVRVANLNADKVDGRDAGAFLGSGGKAADSDELDGLDSGDFLSSDGKAADSELLDGEDSAAFFSGETYFVEGPTTDNSSAVNTSTAAFCDVGDIIIGGGYTGLSPDEGTMINNKPIPTGGPQGWSLFWQNAAPSLDSNVRADAHCADFPPLR